MPINPSFSINAIAQINPAAIALVDTSTGADGNIASRQLLLFEVDSTLLVPAIPWAYAQTSLVATPLTQDIALNVTVNWLDAGGGVLYTASQIYVFTGYSELFLYQLTQNQTSQPNIVADQNYYNNKMQLRCELDAAVQAIQVGSDIYSAQKLIDRITYMINNSNDYF